MFVKGLASGKWQAMEKKVETMADEVFTNVMETEVALAKLES